MTSIVDIPLSQLDPDPDNIREDALANVSALAADIRDYGLQNPLRIYRVADRYRIWEGHRRWAALCMNGAAAAACIIKPAPVDALEKLDGMVRENLHREQLNPIEEARVYRRYLDADLTQGAIAERCGVAPSKVSMYLKLLEELTPDEQRDVADGKISAGRALKTVRERRIRRGVARSDAGGKHAMSVWTPHFNTSHPLHSVAAARCQNDQHPAEDRLGGACGTCWEWAIRRDERVAAQLDIVDDDRPAPAPAELPVLACSRCGVAYSSEVKYGQCVLENRQARKRVVLPAHNWVHRKEQAVAVRGAVRVS